MDRYDASAKFLMLRCDTLTHFCADADAIILDFSLRAEELLSLYPEAHLIASADIRMGLINTGVLLLRNTAWTRRFISEWWSGPYRYNDSDESYRTRQRDWRSSQCDQDAFDRLYSHYSLSENSNVDRENAISVRVKVLPMDALNSHPPATLHHQPHAPVLHLMGETSEMRRRVFHRAWHSGICWDGIQAEEESLPDTYVEDMKLNKNIRVQPQLGISRGVLQALAR